MLRGGGLPVKRDRAHPQQGGDHAEMQAGAGQRAIATKRVGQADQRQTEAGERLGPGQPRLCEPPRDPALLGQ